MGLFSHDFDSAGVTTDAAGHLWVSYVDQYLDPFDPLNQTERLAVYNPIPGTPPLAVWALEKGYLFQTPGSLATLDANSGLERFGGLRAGDLLHLLPDGRILAVRPGSDPTQRPLSTLIFSVKDFFSVIDFRTAIADIYDVQWQQPFNFAGSIQPQMASYGDIAVYRGNILVTGFSYGYPFVMRIDVSTGLPNVKVLLSSRAYEIDPGTGNGSKEPPGIAVNAQGEALTTMPYATGNALDFDPERGAFAPIRFNVNFDRNGGPQPSVLGFLRGERFQVDSRGMTTDSRGNFLIATGEVSSTLSGGSQSIIIVNSDFSNIRAMPISGNFLENTRDVAVGPRNGVADGMVYEAWADFGGGVLYTDDYVTMYRPPIIPPAQPGKISLTVDAVQVSEKVGSVTVTVQRTGGASGDLSTNYATHDGTATAGSDYRAVSGTLYFDDRDAIPQTISIPITADQTKEGDESFTLTLSGASVNTPSTISITIKDGDAPSVTVPGGDFNFVFGIGPGSTQTFSRDVATDGQGNLYVAGTATDYPDFDPGPDYRPIPPAPPVLTDVKYFYVARYDHLGKFAWAVPFFVGTYFGIDSSWDVRSMAADTSGNVYLLLYLRDAQVDLGAELDDLTVYGGDSGRIYVVKLDPTGKFLWIDYLTADADPTVEEASQIETDAAGSVYVSGFLYGTADFDPSSTRAHTITAPSGTVTFFVWSLTADGAFRYVYVPDGTHINSNDIPRIAVAPGGQVTLSGVNYDGLDLDPGGGVTSGAQRLFIARLGADGAFKWGKFFGDQLGAPFTATTLGDVALDPQGNIYLTGSVWGRFTFSIDMAPGTGTVNVDVSNATVTYVEKLDATGNIVWVRSLGGQGNANESYGVRIAVDPWGRVITVGDFKGMGDFDPSTTANAPLTASVGDIGQLFVSKLDPDGKFVDAFEAGGTNADISDDVRGIAMDPLGAITIVGNCTQPAQFGNHEIAHLGGGEFKVVPFIAQLPAQKPILERPKNQTVAEGSAIQIEVQGEYGNAFRAISYRLGQGAPAGATIDAASGRFSWTPTDGPADVSITIIAADGADSQRFSSTTFTVHVDNQAPTVSALSDVELTAGQTLSRAGSLTDPGDDTWTATVDYGDGRGPQAISVAADKTFSLSHIYGQPGRYTVRIAATDDDGGRGESSFSVVVSAGGGHGSGPGGGGPAPVTVHDVRLVSKKGAVSAIVIQLSDGIDAAGAGRATNYRVVAAGRDKKFGTKDDVATKLKSVVYDRARHLVTLSLRGRVVLTKTLRLTLRAAGLTDVDGRPLDGDGDGVPGRDFAVLLTKRGVSATRARRNFGD
jgi:hypothetical protein